MNDPIVAVSESDQIFELLQKGGRSVVYLSFPDEGHGIFRHANKMVYLAYTEQLLAETLGGACEPLDPATLAASSVIIRSTE